jgi:hypothetical protein
MAFSHFSFGSPYTTDVVSAVADVRAVTGFPAVAGLLDVATYSAYSLPPVAGFSTVTNSSSITGVTIVLLPEPYTNKS